MAKGALGQYVLIQNGVIDMIEDSSEEIRDKAVQGISSDTFIKLTNMTREELLKINNGELVILKYLGVQLDETSIFAESTFVEEELAQSMGYSTKNIIYNYLTNLKVPTDKTYTVVWG